MASLTGVFVIPLTALFTTYSAELSFPVAQGSATGYLFAGSQTVGSISGFVWVHNISTIKEEVYLLFGVHCLFLFCSFLITLLTPEELNKKNY
jgi:hypothetical protein